MGKHCCNQWNVMSFWRHLGFNHCCLTVCGAKGQCIVAHSVAGVNLYAAARDWVSRFPFVKSFCLVFIIYSPSLKHEVWLGAWPSQLCSHVSSKCAVCGSCSITSSLKSEWCLVAHGTVSWEGRLRSAFSGWEEQMQLSAWGWLQHRLDVHAVVHECML